MQQRFSLLQRMFRCILTLVITTLAVQAEVVASDLDHFERKIRPILVEHCYECHSDETGVAHGNLTVDDPQHLLIGGDRGPAVVPGDLEKSFLIGAVLHQGDLQMPPEAPLPPHLVTELKQWILAGAPTPTIDPTRQAAGPMSMEEARKFWAFQPTSMHVLPLEHPWATTRIDNFVLSKMVANDLSPASQADRTTLCRRLYYDLIGLPPSPEQIDSFVRDEHPQAYERLVEQLLASPYYGERWARMWLDKARYTDQTASWLNSTAQAHLYRDWVVRAFNDDMPYDQFVLRQLATDMMSETGPEDLPALGFIGLSPSYWKELMLPSEIIKVIVADEWEERVDAVSQTFLGLTVACARCHDHKFDPITAADYQALAGVFASCHPGERAMIADELYEPVRAAKAEIESLRAEIEKIKKQDPIPEELIEAHLIKISELQQTPHFDTPLANAVLEQSLHVVRAGEKAQDGTRLDYRPQPRDLPIFIRGDPNREGEVVKRGFLQVLSPGTERIEFQQGSGRLELAKAIVDQAGDLAARVIVNRIWLEHFGHGIVGTPSNFGVQGDSPTHPELLDDLTFRFQESGWSMKWLHREILLSSTWCQSSEFDAVKVSVDPDNRWLSRMSRRRLDFESWRDTMLAASHTLSFNMGGPAIELTKPDHHRRTLYGLIHRREMLIDLQIHDFPDPGQHSSKRTPTVTPLQGLFALNSPLLLSQAEALATRLQQEEFEDHQRVEMAYQVLFARKPTDSELQLALQFVNKKSATSEQRLRWQQYIHALLATNELLFVD